MGDIDLFAGPGGWDEGIRVFGVTPLGFEINSSACATATAAGHRRVQADIATLDPIAAVQDDVRLLIASPPCQGFSMAGAGRGRDDAEHLINAVSGVEDLGDLELVLDLLHRTMMDDRSLLVLEPLRWALSLQPEFLAWEQVPTVLPIWEACAKVLAAAGYSVDTGILSAEQYGVPQTRRRAILVASREGRARLPVPTHSRYHNISPDRLDDGLMPWVSMGEALHRDPGSLVLRSNYSSGGSTPGRTAAERGRTMRHGGQPSVTITGKFPQWSRENGNFRITIAEASVLQSFPADYPWRGSLVEQGQQVGDAMPPLLARAIVQELLFPELG